MYSLTPSMTLDATYRTDFAQVEVDQQQVNLTRFNLFFPEKRDFFLENSGIFAFGVGASSARRRDLVPFFSRRIGLSAAGTPIPIVGGTRVSGRAGGYDVGVLAMKTEALGTDTLQQLSRRTRKTKSSEDSWWRDRHGSASRAWRAITTASTAPDAHFQFCAEARDRFVRARAATRRAGQTTMAKNL